MKLFVLFALCAAAAAAPAEEFTYNAGLPLDYHLSFGIPEAARIRQYEEELNFDGSRIIGGNQVGLGAHPHLGGIDILMESGSRSVCGCSLLTSTRAVTAAHCWLGFSNTQAKMFTVVYGSQLLYSGGVRVDTADVKMHENYDIYAFANDIAIITHSEVTFNDFIRPINLPSGDELHQRFDGSFAVAAGFGRIGNHTVIHDPDKRDAVLQVISNEECITGMGWRITESVICTSGNHGSTVCFGDSGGPLTIGSGENRILIGLTSFGTCMLGHPAAYTRVTSFVDWIQDRIEMTSQH